MPHWIDDCEERPRLGAFVLGLVVGAVQTADMEVVALLPPWLTHESMTQRAGSTIGLMLSGRVGICAGVADRTAWAPAEHCCLMLVSH